MQIAGKKMDKSKMLLATRLFETFNLLSLSSSHSFKVFRQAYYSQNLYNINALFVPFERHDSIHDTVWLVDTYIMFCLR